MCVVMCCYQPLYYCYRTAVKRSAIAFRICYAFHTVRLENQLVDMREVPIRPDYHIGGVYV